MSAWCTMPVDGVAAPHLTRKDSSLQTSIALRRAPDVTRGCVLRVLEIIRSKSERLVITFQICQTALSA